MAKKTTSKKPTVNASTNIDDPAFHEWVAVGVAKRYFERLAQERPLRDGSRRGGDK